MNLGPLIIDICGHELSSEDKEVLNHPLVGGVILFSKNFVSKDQIFRLINDIHGCTRGRELLITVDHEGGRVQRFKTGFTSLEAPSAIGNIIVERGFTKKTVSEALAKAYSHGATIAKELVPIGVDLSFTPCLDLNWGRSDVIGDRAISSDPELVAILCLGIITGLRDFGLKNCVKHFPGHGWAKEDSHNTFARDERQLEPILKKDIYPYKYLIGTLNVVSSVMASHVVYEKCDLSPASLSKFWLVDVLRKKLNFKGVIFCDDLSMQGVKIESGLLDLVDIAFSAGCDSLLICNDRSGVLKILNDYPISTVPPGLKKISGLKKELKK